MSLTDLEVITVSEHEIYGDGIVPCKFLEVNAVTVVLLQYHSKSVADVTVVRYAQLPACTAQVISVVGNGVFRGMPYALVRLVHLLFYRFCVP